MTKKLTTAFLFILIISAFTANYAQRGNGIIYADSNNLMIIKVKGTHYERGYAQGELLGSYTTDMFQNYIKPQFGTAANYDMVKSIVAEGVLLIIDSLYIVEAKAYIDGMNDMNSNIENLDYVDILLVNSLLDVYSIILGKESVECSSLMSWDSATEASTDLEGKSIITRHIDWFINDVLVRNQVMVIHIPSETNEQAWAEIGFAGMISVLSGFNSNMAVFQHMMGDDNSHGEMSGSYEPIWFTLRKSLELKDPNGDGANNVNDVKYAIDQQPQGFADGYIISALARSTEIHDSLIAMVAEIAADAPVITYRTNDYPDNIPNDNLYTANNQIARNNSMHFCSRYNGIVDNIGDGDDISLISNRDLMRDYSELITNYQFMTFVPELDLFRVSVRDDQPAYLNPDMDYSISNMFGELLSISDISDNDRSIKVFPNPANNVINIEIESPYFDYQIFDISGRMIRQGSATTKRIDISNMAKGSYQIRFFYKRTVGFASFMKN